MTKVVIVDSGGANITSLQCAFARLGARSRVTSDPSTIANAERVVLPGVGAARHAMERLEAWGLVDVLRRLTQPVLGICLGMQLFFTQSEEGDTQCLGIVQGTVSRLLPASGRPVPHMGWNQVRHRREDPLMEGIRDHSYFYFVHAYAAPIQCETIAETEHGQPISAVVRSLNYRGTQFHPERSGRAGARVLANFLRL